MMRRTHAAAGLAIGFGIGQTYPSALPEALAIALFTECAALLPDLDLKLKIKHRGLTHSLLMLITLSLLVNYVAPELTLPFVLGYGSHLLLDLLTVYGIELFYPYHGRIRLAHFRTGGTVDGLLAATALSVSLYCLWEGMW